MTHDSFNVSQDWVKVECSATTHDKMMTGWATKTGPDWIRTDPIAMEYPVRVGALTPIQPYLDRDGLDFAWAYETVRPWLRFPIKHGEYYLMPWIGGANIIWYNKDHFDEAGIPYPKADWTWLDYGEVAQKLTKLDAQGLPIRLGSFSLPTRWWNSWCLPLMEAGGVPFDDPLWELGGYTDPEFLGQNTKTLPGISKEAMKQGLQFNLDLMNKWKGCAKPGYQLPEGTGFLTGNLSMDMGSIGYEGQIITSEKVKRWGVVAPPKAPTERGRHATQAFVIGFALGSHCDHKDEAWEAMKFFYSQPARKCNYETAHYWSWSQDLEEWILGKPGVDPALKDAFAFNATNDAVFIPPVKDFARFFREAIDPIAQLVFTGEMRIDEAVEKMVRDGDAVLKG